MKGFSFALLFLLPMVALWSQSPWIPAAGGGFVQLGASVIPAYDGVFAPKLDESTYPIPRRVTDAGLQAYAEYGLGMGVALQVNVPYRILATGEPTAAFPDPPNEMSVLTGLGNVSLAARLQLLDRAWKLASFLEIQLPAHGEDKTAGLRTGFASWLFRPGLSLGGSWGRHYFYGHSGLQFAAEAISHSYVGGLEWGRKFGGRLTVALALDARLSFENRPNEGTRDWTGLYLNNQEFLSPGIKLLVDLPKGYGLSFGAYGAIVAENVSNNASVNLGAYRKW